MEPFIGQIQAFGFNFAPRDWTTCDGQLLNISQNQALFSLLGTTYGGDGRTTFALPDLRGRTMVHQGSGPGLKEVRLGQKGGSQTITLDVSHMPSHNHTAILHGESDLASTTSPSGTMLAYTQDTGPIYANPVPADEQAMAGDSVVVGNTGGGQAFDNEPPYLGIQVCIALVGLYPTRN